MPRKIRVMFATATALGICVVIFQVYMNELIDMSIELTAAN